MKHVAPSPDTDSSLRSIAAGCDTGLQDADFSLQRFQLFARRFRVEYNVVHNANRARAKRSLHKDGQTHKPNRIIHRAQYNVRRKCTSPDTRAATDLASAYVLADKKQCPFAKNVWRMLYLMTLLHELPASTLTYNTAERTVKTSKSITGFASPTTRDKISNSLPALALKLANTSLPRSDIANAQSLKP